MSRQKWNIEFELEVDETSELYPEIPVGFYLCKGWVEKGYQSAHEDPGCKDQVDAWELHDQGKAIIIYALDNNTNKFDKLMDIILEKWSDSHYDYSSD